MIAFTICSNNYLSKARIFVSSVKAIQQVPVYLFLADRKSPLIKYEEFGFDVIITPEELDIQNLQWQLENYNIIEFNTALKGAAFKYIFAHTDTELAYYFDPDIKVYQPLSTLDELWNNASILLTPHLLRPIPFDGMFPGENLFLNHGTYNLGFLGLKRTETSFNFLDWWCERLAHKCVIDLKEGYFTDQIWLNLVPLLFGDSEVINHPGCNAAYWNLHDRHITFQDDTFMVNHKYPLIFYHFSSFDKTLTRLMPRDDARFNFENRSEMLTLYSDYLNDVKKFEDVNIGSVRYFEGQYPFPIPERPFLVRALSKIIRAINSLVKG